MNGRAGKIVLVVLAVVVVVGGLVWYGSRNTGGGGGTGMQAGESGVARYEAACNVAGLARPLRQTLIVIEEAAIKRGDVTAFRALNPQLMNTVLSIADPDTAITSGAAAPRERITLMLAPASGTEPQLLFTGCVPGMSATEYKADDATKSGITRSTDTFFASGTAEKVHDQGRDYRTQLLEALTRLANGATPVDRGETFTETALVRSLKASTRLFDRAEGLPRLVLFAPRAFAKIQPTATTVAARTAGFADATRAGLRLDQVEVVVPNAPGGLRQDYATAFLLGSGGDLSSWSAGNPTRLPAAPATARYFAGDFNYGKEIYPVQLRVAYAADGQLVNSWFELRGLRVWSVPLSGTVTCGGDQCRVVQDGRGFAHRLDPDPDAVVGANPQLPFGGMRNIEFRMSGSRAEGHIFDPAISEIEAFGRADFPFSLAQTDSRF